MIQTTSVDSHQDIARAKGGFRYLLVLDNFGTAMLFENSCFHFEPPGLFPVRKPVKTVIPRVANHNQGRLT